MIEPILLLPIHYSFILLMLIASSLSIAAVARSSSLSERIAVAGSFSNKIALVILTFGIFRNDWMIGSVGAVILIAGDAGMLILALTELKE
ncbi:MAG: hypothetical protein CBB80_001095 [Synechococcus sp. TMED20]|jgi:multicomponent Na+:H+ antiporter subunit F|nr:MAG: hypothetical protein CBB80_001095 [Synechococcus sp. TMED20]|tara:strand:- start:1911 stop:2183 length:273 start_codon:yes stop_codon:yes gene_type:complete